MIQRFRTLRTISVIVKFLAFAVGVIAVVAAIAVCLAGVMGNAAAGAPSATYSIEVRFGVIGGMFGGIVFAAVIAVGGGGLAAALYAFGDLILLQIAVEENTRATFRLLEAQVLRMRQEQGWQQPYYPPGP